ncbi:MAG TPA: NAD(P)/FAD-dependent oxidoreductase [Polyangiaceae bacterium]|jgi:flavin-dependent dehydrogenase
MSLESHDVVVIGGGPAGSVCATRLASKGRRVLVLEREKHPRFHLGESLLPNSMGVLSEVGVLDEVRARFLVKRGARFVDGLDPACATRYDFAEAFHATWDHAFQVPRDEFDALLFRRAGESGAELREQWEVTRILREGERAAGVEVRGPDGALHEIGARFVVDASGRNAVMARASAGVERIAHLDRTALFTQVRGAWRDVGAREGDIQIVVFGKDSDDRGWFWFIPFADGRTSVGCVVSGAWMRARRGLGPEALFEDAVRGSPAATFLLAGAPPMFAARATADFSFRVETLRGHGWVAVGDASGFIDPLFSTGAHLAMNGGLQAADAIDAALEAGDVSRDRFEAWERSQRLGAELFVGVVQAFYAGDLTSYLFAKEQHPFLRRAITSLLAGDVFDPAARWVRELRDRFPVQASRVGATGGSR